MTKVNDDVPLKRQLANTVSALGATNLWWIIALRLLAGEDGVVRESEDELAALMKVIPLTAQRRIKQLRALGWVVGERHEVIVLPTSDDEARIIIPTTKLIPPKKLDASGLTPKAMMSHFAQRYRERYDIEYAWGNRGMCARIAKGYNERYGKLALPMIDVLFEQFDARWKKPREAVIKFTMLRPNWLGDSLLKIAKERYQASKEAREASNNIDALKEMM